MASISAMARVHFAALVDEAAKTGYGADEAARAMLTLVVETYMKSRSLEDVRAELLGAAENLDPDTDYAFMRP